jgi:hypothetical protein
MKIKTTNFLISLLLCFVFAGVQTFAQNIIFIANADREADNIEFLERQGFNVTKFWPTDDIRNAGPDTIDMLNAADLVIIGRSGPSTSFQEEKKVWNDSITAPLMLICQWKSRSSRLNWFESTAAYHENAGPPVAYAKIADPTDPIFANATIAADSTMGYSFPQHDFIRVDSVINGEIVATYNDNSILIARWDADEEFYPDAGDSAAGPRTYFGYGNDDGKVDNPDFFKLTRDAKAVFLAEVCRMMGIAIQAPVFANIDYRVLMVTDEDMRDSLQIEFLEDEGYSVDVWEVARLGSEPQSTLDMINARDLVVIGRAPHSSNFQQGIDKYTWNKKVQVPVVLNSQWIARNSRLNWLNSGDAYHVEGIWDTIQAKILDPTDAIFGDITVPPADSIVGWSEQPEDLIRLDTTTNATILVTAADTNGVLVARIDPCVVFYPGAAVTEKAAAPRTYFGFGNDNLGWPNFFPLTDDAKTVYADEINRLIFDPYTVCTDYPSDDATLSSLTVDVGTMTPAFDAAVTEYMVIVPQGTDSVLITAVANDVNADTVTGTGYVKMGDGMVSAPVKVIAEDTYTSITYTLTLQTELIIDGAMGEGEWDWVEAMPVEKLLNVSNIADENDYSLYFKMLWSDDALYLLIDVIDDIVYLGNTNVYMDDNIEIYFDMNNSKIEKWPRDRGWASRPWDQMDDNDMQLRIQPTEDAVLYESNLFGTTVPNTVVNGITFAHAETEGTGYVFEMMLDFDSLAIGYSGFVAQEGTEIGFDIDGSDNDGDPDARDELGWSADRQLIYTDAGLWGTLEFNADGTVTQILDEEAPSAPRNLAAEASGMNVTLSWDPSSDNIIVDEYHIYVEGVKIDSVMAKETDNEVTVDVTGHVPGGTYEVTVTGVDPSDNEGDADTTEVTVTGIEEAIVSYSIYPVPASDILIVENTDLIESIEVFDLVGQSVMNVTVKAKYIELKTSNLKPGVYVIKLHTAGEVYSEQLLIK